MTTSPLWGARVVMLWVKVYTAAMPPPLAAARRDELLADVHDQVEDGASAALSPRRVSWGLVGRMLRGVQDDVIWRAQVEAELTGRDLAVARPAAVLTALGILALPFWAASETARAHSGWLRAVQAPAWAMACFVWALSIAYAVVALVYVTRERRSRR